MKLVRFGPRGHERPGLWLEDTPARGEGRILDVRAMAFDIHDFDGHFFSHWGLERLQGLLREPRPVLVPAEGVRLGTPVACPGKIICLGANYAAHAAEFGAHVPDQPVLFAKAPTALNGPFDPIVLPDGAGPVDAEAELALVLGQQARNVPEARALECIAGLMILNDVTDRKAQRESSQWFWGKSCDTFCPAGPFLVTLDEVAGLHDLRICSKLNGEVLQEDRTASMLFPVSFLVAYISRRITLLPGDIIATGTPPGIGSARNPPRVLRPGDVIEVGIEKLGEQRCQILASPR